VILGELIVIVKMSMTNVAAVNLRL